ncbi:uncharacterized protein MYCFIDRAFT_29572 [Pseudocercospora fijiensis CIRAD86]|uniref:Major facilitator superfamily (MFS) profile domain-containing protein n=1 Tax=Pseudocercospora fijiensis (strain CIRAD86) TaxID=383855 RepID=M3BC03_PSEFD|nr:uncharacterized protein MYCFIDRAFT_29572 [Pseudocercospora fijiensis CIRAD86]EME86713.1 hypothetical protein MYCFIDRAFT_29572 [Pseudocercospora fijiensis CIRAD86]
MDTTPSTTSLWTSRKCIVVCCIVATANMQYGFDSAAIGSLQAMPGFLKVFGYPDKSNPIGYGIDSTVQQLISSLLTLGSFLSSLAAGPFSSYFGRREGLWVACILGAVSCAVQLATKNTGVLYFGRLLMGLSNGFLVTFSNVYVSEVAPAHIRGVMVALFAYWVNIGSIIGSVVTNYTSKRFDKSSYQIPIACLYIVPAFLAAGLFFVPESPRWLLHKGKESEARRALGKLRSDELPQEVFELEWVEMIRGTEEEQATAKSIGFLDMFKGVDLRRTLLCYGIIASQSGSGVWFIIAYQTYFFSISGITKSFEFSIMNTCIGFIGVNVGMYAMKNWFGRRSILMIGATICGISQLIPAIVWSINPMAKSSGSVLVGFMAVFQFGYNSCVGATSYPVATELVSSRLRAYTVGSATSIGYIFAWLCSFCSPYFINPKDLNLGAQYGYIWAASNLACVVFFFFFMPEMKGRSLEQLDEIFAAKVPARKFKDYQCREIELLELIGDDKLGDGKATTVEKVEEAA